MPRSLSRRAMFAPLFGALLFTACSEPAPVLRTDFPPLTYDYLPAIRLSVANIKIENHATIVPNDFSPQSPVLPTDALVRMAQDRLKASGNSGTLVFTIDQASIVRTETGLTGVFEVHLDVQGNDQQQVAYASARVTRSYTGDITDMRGTLYDMTKQMMDDMNVELEVQIRRTLGDWVQNVSTAPSAAPVQSQDLTPPAPTAPSPGAPTPLSPPTAPAP